MPETPAEMLARVENMLLFPEHGRTYVTEEDAAALRYVLESRAELLAALIEMEAMYTHAWDVVGGGLLMTEKSVARFDAACDVAQKAIAKCEGATP